ncbi:MAG: MarR family winged helix-turn-helix transcriptional regulator [Sphingobacterium sp.]|jgi:DNA-binding MarR family transcriptional regulator|uniref:MarR family winged helix-turn-helix transcriptional regulator n=1 Tax=Sphingobacterium sp. TaxID=341027 RepID=UPI00281C0B9F|nr:MarR family winged helix-turn-helix transcriptional regulator [Sphingobacterium sp.]MDR0264367.1 MarR family winged helix-turn-helix transcriptional regulator [Sphingobacterium sp.]
MKNEFTNAVKPLVDSIIALRTSLKQYYIQKIKEQQLDITYEMLQVLAALWKNEQMNQQDIAIAIQKNKASVTPLIDNLCKRDLVKRVSDPNDRRNNFIKLTVKGDEYRTLLDPVQQDLYNAILQEIAEKKVLEITASLEKLTAIIDKQ